MFTLNYQVSIYDSTEASRVLVLRPNRDPDDWGPDFVIGGDGDGLVQQIVRALDKEGTTHSGYLRWRYEKGPWNANVHLSYSASDSALVSTDNGHFSEFEFNVADVSQVNFNGIDEDGMPDPEGVEVFDATGAPVNYRLLENYSPVNARARAGDTQTDEEIIVYKADIARDLDFIPTDRFTLTAKVGVYREENTITKVGRGINYEYRYVGPEDVFDPGVYLDTIYTGVEHSFGYPSMQWVDLTKTYAFFQNNPDYWSDDNDFETFEEAMAAEAEGIEESVAFVNWNEYASDNKRIKEINDAYYAQIKGEFFNHRLTVLTGVRYQKSKRSGYGPAVRGNWHLFRNPDGSIYIPDEAESARRFQQGVSRMIQAVFENPRFQDLRDEMTADGIEWEGRAVVPGSLEAAQEGISAKVPIRSASNGAPAYSLHTAYDVTDNLVARIAFARTYGQVNYESDRGGILEQTSIQANETGEGGSISVGNPDLEPWVADNWDYSLTYYTDTGGKFAISYFRKNVENFHLELEETLTEENYVRILTQYGITPLPVYGEENYEFSTMTNGEGTARTDGWEFQASQSLGIFDFLGEWGERFYLFGSYTMKELSANQFADGAIGSTADNFAAGGISYQDSRLSVRVNFTYRNETINDVDSFRLVDANGDILRDENGDIVEAVIYEYEPSEVKVDLNLGYRFYKNYEIFANARNITNTRSLLKRKSVGDYLPDYAATYEINDYGVQWTIGVRGRF